MTDIAPGLVGKWEVAAHPIALSILGNSASRVRVDWVGTALKIHSGAGLASSPQRKLEAASTIASSLAGGPMSLTLRRTVFLDGECRQDDYEVRFAPTR
jgi:hypothetical protein